MASFNPQDFGLEDPPPRPTTPPVRRGFLVVLFLLSLAVPWSTASHSSPTGSAIRGKRRCADSEALAKLDKEGIVNRASVLFWMATSAVSPAVVNVQSERLRGGGEGFPGFPLGRKPPEPRVSRNGFGIGRHY